MERKGKKKPRLTVEQQRPMYGWLLDHLHHPYPSEGEKQELAKQSGLVEKQVTYWFINIRSRYWRPCLRDTIPNGKEKDETVHLLTYSNREDLARVLLAKLRTSPSLKDVSNEPSPPPVSSSPQSPPPSAEMPCLFDEMTPCVLDFQRLVLRNALPFASHRITPLFLCLVRDSHSLVEKIMTNVWGTTAQIADYILYPASPLPMPFDGIWMDMSVCSAQQFYCLFTARRISTKPTALACLIYDDRLAVELVLHGANHAHANGYHGTVMVQRKFHGLPKCFLLWLVTSTCAFI